MKAAIAKLDAEIIKYCEYVKVKAPTMTQFNRALAFVIVITMLACRIVVEAMEMEMSAK